MLSKLAIIICVIMVTAFQFILGAEDASFALGIQYERRTSAVIQATALINAFEGIERSRMGIKSQHLKDVTQAQETLSLLIDEQILYFVMSDAALLGAKLSTEMQSLLKVIKSSERQLLQRVFDFRIGYPSKSPAIHKALNKIIDDLRPLPASEPEM